MTKKEELTCKFCGDSLGIDPHGWFRSHEHQTATGHGTITCKNRVGRDTLHYPDTAQWNGGVDFSDGSVRYRPGAHGEAVYASDPETRVRCVCGAVFEGVDAPVELRQHVDAA